MDDLFLGGGAFYKLIDLKLDIKYQTPATIVLNTKNSVN